MWARTSSTWRGIVTPVHWPVCFFGAAAWKAKARDETIGWSAAQRERALSRVANNARFLILPWVRVPHLARHLLSAVVRRLDADWRAKYGHGIALLETFVDRERFRGTCYRAAGWVHVGATSGRRPPLRQPYPGHAR